MMGAEQLHQKCSKQRHQIKYLVAEEIDRQNRQPDMVLGDRQGDM